MSRQWIAYLGCSFAIGAFSSFNNFTVSLWLSNLITSYIVISLLANTRGLLGSLVSPVAGAWSDRLWLGWLGRRRPFILVGGLSAALLLALTPTISRLPLPAALAGLPPDLQRLAPAVVALLLMTLCFNTMDDLHGALLADLTAGPDRNRLASFKVVVDMCGNVLMLLLAGAISAMSAGLGTGVPDVAFWVAAALISVGILVTVLGVREPEPAVWAAGNGHDAPDAGPRLTPRIMLREYRAAAILCLVVFFYWFGVNAVMPLVSIYTRDILGASEAEAQYLPALMLLSTTFMAIPMGRLGTRYGKRRIIGAGYVIMCCAALAGLIIATVPHGAILFLLAGIGNAAVMVLVLPLLADLVPRTHIGAATGLLAAAGGIASPLSAVVAGQLSDMYGPRAIFGVMVVTVVIALLLLTAVRQPAPTLEGAPLPAEAV